MSPLNKASETAKKEEYVLALDVGGTFIKSALVTLDGLMLRKTFRKTAIDSEGTAETIIETFIQIIVFRRYICPKKEVSHRPIFWLPLNEEVSKRWTLR